MFRFDLDAVRSVWCRIDDPVYILSSHGVYISYGDLLSAWLARKWRKGKRTMRTKKRLRFKGHALLVLRLELIILDLL
ncbi:hypothetical protein CRG98_006497 [Punica granatum]|uniref:Uncharacterized protein n=1 Tax=Punica granatum TaxID=22663 RepID=A0A2I0KXA4_PUNGR|nr:hypothetical protein CRG98_006497 [Punica granatum]